MNTTFVATIAIVISVVSISLIVRKKHRQSKKDHRDSILTILRECQIEPLIEHTHRNPVEKFEMIEERIREFAYTERELRIHSIHVLMYAAVHCAKLWLTEERAKLAALYAELQAVHDAPYPFAPGLPGWEKKVRDLFEKITAQKEFLYTKVIPDCKRFNTRIIPSEQIPTS